MNSILYKGIDSGNKPMSKPMKVKVLHIAIPQELYDILIQKYSMEQIINNTNEYLFSLGD